MASIQKRNKKYAVVYTYEDSQGNRKQKHLILIMKQE